MQKCQLPAGSVQARKGRQVVVGLPVEKRLQLEGQQVPRRHAVPPRHVLGRGRVQRRSFGRGWAFLPRGEVRPNPGHPGAGVVLVPGVRLELLLYLRGKQLQRAPLRVKHGRRELLRLHRRRQLVICTIPMTIVATISRTVATKEHALVNSTNVPAYAP